MGLAAHLLSAVVGLSTLAAPPALDLEARLLRASVCRDARDWACAERELAAARPLCADAPRDQQARVWRWSAEVALSTDRQADAASHLAALLALNPDFVAPSWPDAWQTALADARRALPDTTPPELRVSLPMEPTAGRPVAVDVQVTDGSTIRAVTVLVDGGASPGQPTSPTRLGLTFERGRWVGIIPGGLVAAPELRLRVLATDAAGNDGWWPRESTAHVLAVAAPPVVPEPAAVETPLVETWWFWTAIGGAVVVAAATSVTVWALTRDDDPQPNTNTTPTGSVEVRWAWPSQ